MIRVLFFGPLADAVGQRVVDLEYFPGMSLGALCDDLSRAYPEALSMLAFVAVNGVQTRDMLRVLEDHAEIAFMAKFSGG